MKTVIALAGTATLGLVVASATFGGGSQDTGAYLARGKAVACSNRTLKGTYGIQMQGSRPVPGGEGIEQVIGVVIRTYDGSGNFTQFDNVKGAVSGFAPDRPGSGTYAVNSDCTATTLFQPGPGVSIEERMVILDFGHEVRSITVTPQPLMVTAVGKRVGWW